MFTTKFKNDLFKISHDNFNEKALELFRFQALNNQVYAKYLQHLNTVATDIHELHKIPFLPISLFKNHKIITGQEVDVEKVFLSSGTTQNLRSKHYIKDLLFYEKISTQIFENAYGGLSNFIVLALLPSYLENTESSLLYMIRHFIQRSGSHLSRFISLKEADTIKEAINNKKNRHILLIGVTYALLELADTGLVIKDIILMETGGMKGRGVERPREEVHVKLKTCFNVNSVHSEYGMTELLSQAYSKGNGVFSPPTWMKILIREINDPFSINVNSRPGGINIIDLANVDSCAFIATDDIGSMIDQNSFKIIGRIDHSETRGCNQLEF